jgi:5'(3')-deoxyribonucleotidase
MKILEIADMPGTRPLVYVDMDGVLADFFGQLARHHGQTHWKKVGGGGIIVKTAAIPGFFRGLPKLDQADELVRGVKHIAGSYRILSSPLSGSPENATNSAREKADWLREHFPGALAPADTIFDHEKYKYAVQSDGTPNILIDDYHYNIDKWNQHGGIGISYKNGHAEQVLQQLQVSIKQADTKQA